jgi:diaminohydroxyphosphoribosylaminopyrimidine deaminase/5-amino-6-(5-phosphoribosylamino)uracil reductase
VGTNTVLVDDPELTARKPNGELYSHQPLRVILGETKIKRKQRVFNEDAETVQYETHSIHGALAELWQRGVGHVWVEGGARVASQFVKFGLVDEILVYQAPLLIGGDRTSLRNLGVDNMSEAINLEFKEMRALGKDIFIRAVPIKKTPMKGAN